MENDYSKELIELSLIYERGLQDLKRHREIRIGELVMIMKKFIETEEQLRELDQKNTILKAKIETEECGCGDDEFKDDE